MEALPSNTLTETRAMRESRARSEPLGYIVAAVKKAANQQYKGASILFDVDQSETVSTNRKRNSLVHPLALTHGTLPDAVIDLLLLAV